MLLGGDEFMRTQLGNNNAYCQDNEISWYDWGLVEENKDLVGFVKKLIDFRKRHIALLNGIADRYRWYNRKLNEVDWLNSQLKTFSCHLDGSDIVRDGRQSHLFSVFSAGFMAHDFQLPELPGYEWQVVFDTWHSDGEEFADADELPLEPGESYTVAPQSVVTFAARPVAAPAVSGLLGNFRPQHIKWAKRLIRE